MAMYVLFHKGKKVGQSDAPYVTAKVLKEGYSKSTGVPVKELQVVKLV